MGRRRRPRILVWHVSCKHDVVSESYHELGWRTCSKRDVREGRWDVAWSDTPVSLFKTVSFSSVLPHHRLNHFPLMQYLCRKDLLASNIHGVQHALRNLDCKASFSFLPQTWIFPSETQKFWCAVTKHFQVQQASLTPREKKARAKRLRLKDKRAKRKEKAHAAKGYQRSSKSRESECESSSEEEDELEPFTCIAKPESGSQGKGIVLFQLASDYPSLPAKCRTKQLLDRWKAERIVVQQFIDPPLLVDAFKWDMRVYVLITSLDPLTVYLYDDGLARFCTEEYETPEESNLDNEEMHLTNFSINWESDMFIDTEDDDTGSKRSLASVFESYLGVDAVSVWQSIAQAVAQTLLAFTPKLQSAYRSHFGHLRKPELAPEDGVLRSVCFEILGFDFMLDEDHGLHLLEVNSAPSLGTETSLDERIKSDLLQETFGLLDLDPRAKQTQRLCSKRLLQARQEDHLKRREELLRSKRDKGSVGFLSQARGHSCGPDSSTSKPSTSKTVKAPPVKPPSSIHCPAGSPLKAVRSRRKISNTDESSTEECSEDSADEDSDDDESSSSEASSGGVDESVGAEHKEEDLPLGAVHEEEDLFSVHDGFISEGGDLHQESMTLEEAKCKCVELLGCAGFYHQGPPTEDVVEIIFKSKWDNSNGGKYTWTSYKFCKEEVRCMEGVGPYVTEHYVQILPNPAVPGHDAILAAAQSLIAI